MLRSFKALFLASVVATGSLIMLAPAPAQAHVDRAAGTYHLAIGWGAEPTYVGIFNSVQIFLHNAKDKPVNDLGDTLKVEVINGTQRKSLSFEPDFEVGEFGTEGDYRAWIIPTTAGTYTFHVAGTIKKTRVNITVTSGPDTFDDVKEPADIEFPTKVPSGTELVARLDRELPRVDARLAADRKKARDDASNARTLAIVAIAVGGLGVVIGAVSVVKKR